MEHQPSKLAALLTLCLAALLALPDGAHAEEAASALPPAELETAKAMQAEAESLRKAADALLEEETAACARKFLENDCRNAARKRHLESLRAARGLAAQGRKMEYQARVKEREAKRRARAAKVAERGSKTAPDCLSQESCAAEAALP
ncbi:MAG: hypothetical protein LBF51_11270 [Zoogloeaceae bacterium]|jgi:hypothetical protein|nr:hypothetical protein [Zoogloeaceae bacterium]